MKKQKKSKKTAATVERNKSYRISSREEICADAHELLSSASHGRMMNGKPLYM